MRVALFWAMAKGSNKPKTVSVKASLERRAKAETKQKNFTITAEVCKQLQRHASDNVINERGPQNQSEVVEQALRLYFDSVGWADLGR